VVSVLEKNSRSCEPQTEELVSLLNQLGAAQIVVDGDDVACCCLWPSDHYRDDEREATLAFNLNEEGEYEYECGSCGRHGDEYGLRYHFREELERLNGPVCVEPLVAEFQGLSPYLPVGWDAEDPVTWLIPRADYDAAIRELSKSLLRPEEPEPVAPASRSEYWRAFEGRDLKELIADAERIGNFKTRQILSAPCQGKGDLPGDHREEQYLFSVLARHDWMPYEAAKLCDHYKLPRLTFEWEKYWKNDEPGFYPEYFVRSWNKAVEWVRGRASA
jgi:hypothetical protein